MKTNGTKRKKQRDLLHYIRRSQLKCLPYPLILLCISLFLALLLYQAGPLSPLPPSALSVLAEKDLDLHPCVSVSASNLYYSGDDYVVNGRVKGHFYYSLTTGQCQFFILNPSGDTKPDFIRQISLNGRLIQSEELYAQLVSHMASRLNLSQDELGGVVSPVIISQPDVLPLRVLLFGLLLLACMLLCAVSLLRALLCLLFPACSRTYRRLRQYGNPKKIWANVEKELGQNGGIQTADMALTNRYLIEFSGDLSTIVPLEAVIWIYKMGSIRHRLPTFKKTMRYTLNLVTIDGKAYAFKNKKRGDVVMIQEEMSRRYPNFFFGYSEEHEEMVRHMIKKWKATHRA